MSSYMFVHRHTKCHRCFAKVEEHEKLFLDEQTASALSRRSQPASTLRRLQEKIVNASNEVHYKGLMDQKSGYVPANVDPCEIECGWEKHNEACGAWVKAVAELQTDEPLSTAPDEDSEEGDVLIEYRSETAASVTPYLSKPPQSKFPLLNRSQPKTLWTPQSEKRGESSNCIKEKPQVSKEEKEKEDRRSWSELVSGSKKSPDLLESSSKHDSKSSQVCKGKEAAETSYAKIISRAEEAAKSSNYTTEYFQRSKEEEEEEPRGRYTKVQRASDKPAEPVTKSSSKAILQRSQDQEEEMISRTKTPWRSNKSVEDVLSNTPKHSPFRREERAAVRYTKILSRSDKPSESAANLSNYIQDNFQIVKGAEKEETEGSDIKVASSTELAVPAGNSPRYIHKNLRVRQGRKGPKDLSNYKKIVSSSWR